MGTEFQEKKGCEAMRGVGYNDYKVRCGSRLIGQRYVRRRWYETVFGGTDVVLWKAQFKEGAEKRKCEGRRMMIENFVAREKRCKR